NSGCLRAGTASWRLLYHPHTSSPAAKFPEVCCVSTPAFATTRIARHDPEVVATQADCHQYLRGSSRAFPRVWPTPARFADRLFSGSHPLYASRTNAMRHVVQGAKTAVYRSVRAQLRQLVRWPVRVD